MNRKRGLGSGLDALIPSSTATTPLVRDIDIDAIQANRNQPRTRFDEQALEDLAASIREHGLIQPLIVTMRPDGGYELIAGERRWRAARRAGLAQVPALVKDATPQQLLELALVENVQRADLNPLEEGMAYQTLKDEFALTDEEIARRVSKSRVAVVNARRLIRLIPQAQQSLLDGVISAGHGRALLRLEQPDQQAAALALLVHRDLSVRETERLADLVLKPMLTPPTQQALLVGAIVSTQAEALLRLEDAAQQAEVLDFVLSQGLGVRETERLCHVLAEGAPLDLALAQVRVQSAQSATPAADTRTRPAPGQSDTPEPRPARSLSPEDAETQRLFEEALSTPVQVVRSGSTIRVTITLFNDEQLQGLYDLVVGAVDASRGKS